MRSVEFDPAARVELDAADRYEVERPGLGIRFYAAVERATKLISRFPAVGPRVPGIPAEIDVRRRLVRGFPFWLAY